MVCRPVSVLIRDRTASVGPGARVGVDATPVGTSLGMALDVPSQEVEAVVDVDSAGLVLCQSQSHGGCDPGGPRPGWAWAWARVPNTITARIVGAAGPGRVRRTSVLPVTVPAVRVRVPAPAPGRSAHRSRPGAILASRGDKIPPCGAPDLVSLTSPFPCEDSCVQEGLDQAKNPFIADASAHPAHQGRAVRSRSKHAAISVSKTHS